MSDVSTTDGNDVLPNRWSLNSFAASKMSTGAGTWRLYRYSHVRGNPKLSTSAIVQGRRKFTEVRGPHLREGTRVRLPLRSGAYVHHHLRFDENSGCKSRSRPKMGQVATSTGLGLQESQTHIRRSSTREEGRKFCSFRVCYAPLASQTLQACGTAPKIQEECRFAGQRQRWQ